jgi:methylphosphotriester-DNA--protein-cysteine methyltransferase
MSIQSVSQEAAPLDQIVQQVVQMIQQGATEEQVIGMLKQMGLDDEDIAAVFQAVIEMLQGPSIDSELAALG